MVRPSNPATSVDDDDEVNPEDRVKDQLHAAVATGSLKDMMDSVQKHVDPEVIGRAVELLRHQGNKAFGRGSYQDAIELYDQAIAGAPGDKTLYSNRSLANLKLRRYDAALKDAEMAIKLDGMWPKGYYRKGAVLVAMERWEGARPYLRRVLRDAPEDHESQALLRIIEQKVADKTASAEDDAKTVCLPRKVYYPTQEWFTKNRMGESVVKQLKGFGDLDSIRAVVETVDDADLVHLWVQWLKVMQGGGGEASRPPAGAIGGVGMDMLMVGSLAGVAAFSVCEGIGGQQQQGEVRVVERHAWTRRLVAGVVKKNLLRRPEYEGRIRVLKCGVDALGEQELSGVRAVVWLDWDFSMLGTGVVKAWRQMNACRKPSRMQGGDKGTLPDDHDNDDVELQLLPSEFSVYAMAIEILPDAPAGVAEMVWEASPTKFELADTSYRPLTDPQLILSGSLCTLRPKHTEVAFPVTTSGRVHAVVYWYTLTLPSASGSKPAMVFDSSRLSSVGRAVCYGDPVHVDAGGEYRTVCYRSETQLGFWPTPDTPALKRVHHLPKWYPDMLSDEVNRNSAYRTAIGKLCRGKRVLDAGCGTGLLSWYALETAAAKVVGCEAEEALADVCRRTYGGRGLKVLCKDVRNLRLIDKPQVVVHELFDTGMLGEGVLHLLEGQRRACAPSSSTTTAPSTAPSGDDQSPLTDGNGRTDVTTSGDGVGGDVAFLPVGATVYGQLLELRFEDVDGVNLTLLNPYRYRPSYHQSDCKDVKVMSDPFVMDQVNFKTTTTATTQLVLPEVRAAANGVVSAIRTWFIVDFGDGETKLDSRGHWKYALQYLTEARFVEGELVPLMATRTSTEYVFRMPEDLLRGRTMPTPRMDTAWMAAEESLQKMVDDVLMRVSVTTPEEANAIVRVVKRIASHPPEFGVAPVMAHRLLHAVLNAKRNAQPRNTSK